LRARWQNAVREEPGRDRPETSAFAESPQGFRAARRDQEAGGDRRETCPTWGALVVRLLGGGRLTWAAVAACWILVVFFRASAPESPRPAVSAAPISWKQVLMVLKKDDASKVASPASSPRGPLEQPSRIGPRSRWAGAAQAT
jgi:hypothetical protein